MEREIERERERERASERERESERERAVSSRTVCIVQHRRCCQGWLKAGSWKPAAGAGLAERDFQIVSILQYLYPHSPYIWHLSYTDKRLHIHGGPICTPYPCKTASCSNENLDLYPPQCARTLLGKPDKQPGSKGPQAAQENEPKSKRRPAPKKSAAQGPSKKAKGAKK